MNILLIVTFAACLPFMAKADVYSTLCRRTGGTSKCYDSNTWGFDEDTRKCYNVKANEAPCGFFTGEKGCEDFCLSTAKR